MEKVNVTILFSGGLDSTSCVHIFSGEEYSRNLLFVDYGQLSNKQERSTVLQIAKEMEIPLKICEYKNNITLHSGEILGRNLFLLSAALMEGHNKGIIAMGIHSGTSYYDCSPDFYKVAKEIVNNYSSGRLTFVAPFLNWDKLEIYNYFIKNKLNRYKTYSCELGLQQPCGKCRSCKDLEYLYDCKKFKYSS